MSSVTLNNALHTDCFFDDGSYFKQCVDLNHGNPIKSSSLKVASTITFGQK